MKKRCYAISCFEVLNVLFGGLENPTWRTKKKKNFNSKMFAILISENMYPDPGSGHQKP
jgi:hypothetical protein